MALTSLITGKPPSSYRNDLDLSCGFRFQANRNLSITGLGLAVLTIFNQSKTVQLWTEAGSLLASCVVTPSSSLFGDFAYESISPVILSSGGVYRIAGTYTKNGDNWANTQSMAGYYSSNDITVTGSCYTQPSLVFPIVIVSGGAFGYGWPTLIEGASVNLGQRQKTSQASIRSTF
jgi:hypothetical protein